MPGTCDEKYFASRLIWRQNHSKLCKQNFAGSLALQLFSEKLNLSLVHKFQAIGLVNNLNKKAENPRSGRKSSARCSDNVDAVKVLSEGVWKSPSEDIPKNLVFHVHRCKET